MSVSRVCAAEPAIGDLEGDYIKQTIRDVVGETYTPNAINARASADVGAATFTLADGTTLTGVIDLDDAP